MEFSEIFMKLREIFIEFFEIFMELYEIFVELHEIFIEFFETFMRLSEAFTEPPGTFRKTFPPSKPFTHQVNKWRVNKNPSHRSLPPTLAPTLGRGTIAHAQQKP